MYSPLFPPLPKGVWENLKGISIRTVLHIFQTNREAIHGGLLYFPDEEKRLGKSFIDAVRKEYDESLRMLLRDNPDSQFGWFVNEPYYKEGYIPRLRNEIIDVMDA